MDYDWLAEVLTPLHVKQEFCCCCLLVGPLRGKIRTTERKRYVASSSKLQITGTYSITIEQSFIKSQSLVIVDLTETIESVLF